MAVQLTSQQRAAVENRGGELLVSAAAGSGKTRILVERLLNRVEEERLDLDHFLVITYTKAAAAELQGKIMDELNARLASRPEDSFLRRQKLVIYRAQISTIHAFCTTLLREDGYRLELNPDFRVGDETECALLKQQVLARLLEARYEQIESLPEFAALVDTLSAGRDDSRLTRIVLDIHGRIQSHPRPERWLADQAAAFDLRQVKDVGNTAWGRLLLEDVRRKVSYWHSCFVEALDQLREDAALEKAYAESFDTTLDRLDDFLSALDRGWDSARAVSELEFFPKLGRATKVEDKNLQEQLKHMRDKAKDAMTKIRAMFADSSADLLEDMESVRPVVETLLQLVRDFDRAYTQEKRRRNLVDFSDLEHLALSLLTQENGTPTPLALRWQERFAEVMVDEYQDTNEVQNAIFNAVSDHGKHLFQVGDVKQSIYRFRLADPTIFLNKYRAYPDAGAAQSGQPRRVVLSYNFRSRASVLEGVNFIFSNIMSTAFGELEYTSDQRLYPRLPYPEQSRDQVELNVVDMAALEQEEGEAKTSRDAAEAEFVARRVRSLLDEGFPVTQGDGFRMVQPEDIAILYRSPGSVMGHLTRALDRHRVPWVSDGSGDFFAETEVAVTVAFLEIVDNPRQDVPLVSVLTSPIYSFTGDDLARLRAACPQGDLYQCVVQGAEAGEEKCLHFLAQLNRLRSQAVDLAGSKLLWQLYEQTGLTVIYGAMEGGEARQENLRLLHDYARRLESSGHQGVFGLVNHLRRLRQSGEGLPMPGRESGGGVRIMSIHKSKGLEFPVVLVAGLNRLFNKMDQQAPVLFHPKLGIGPSGLDPKLRIEYPTLARRAVAMQLEREMKAEEMRLLYVAMTRAREKLILICTTTDWSKQAAKLSIHAGAHPDPEALNTMSCVGEWLLLPVLARPDAAILRTAAGITCPLLIPEDHWDIRLERAPKPGIARAREEEAPKLGHHLTQEERERLAWRNPNERLANTPSKATATQLKGRELDAEAAEGAALPPTPMEFARPRFDQKERGLTANQIGTAVHTVMQLIRLDHTQEVAQVREEIARLQAQESLSPQEAAAVKPEQVAAFFRSALGQEALHADDLRREFKFSVLESASALDPELPEEEQVLLQGVIDCCFTGSGGLTVVDFKTDRVRHGEEAEHSQRYRIQLEVYTRALSRILDRPVERRVLWYFATGRGVDL
jgi:ATP-dependent helicase/nuclease subunit A